MKEWRDGIEITRKVQWHPGFAEYAGWAGWKNARGVHYDAVCRRKTIDACNARLDELLEEAFAKEVERALGS